VVGVGTAIYLGSTRSADDRTLGVASESVEERAEDAARAPAQPAPGEGAVIAEAPAILPRYTDSDENYTVATLTATVRRFATEAEAALDEGFPRTAREFYRGDPFSLLAKPALKAVECVNTGVPPDRTVVPFLIEAASFEERPAYLVVYLRGDDADSQYDRIQVVVVDRESCGVLHFARQNL
jgi:hypothetical protein